MTDYLPWVFGVLALIAATAGTVYWCMNVSYGPEQETAGVVSAKRHEYGSTLVTTDEKGNVHVHQDPDEFRVSITTSLGDFETDSWTLYSAVKVGSPVRVWYRQRFWKGQADKLIFEGAR